MDTEKRFWVVEPLSKQRRGPYAIRDLKELDWFGHDSQVAAEGSDSSAAWKSAKDVWELRDALRHLPPPVAERGPLAKLFGPIGGALVSPVGLSVMIIGGVLAFTAYLFMVNDGASGSNGQDPVAVAAPAAAPAAGTLSVSDRITDTGRERTLQRAKKTAAASSSRSRKSRRRRPSTRKRRAARTRDITPDGEDFLEMPAIESMGAIKAKVAEDIRREEERVAALKKAQAAARAAERRAAGKKGEGVMDMSVDDLQKYLRRGENKTSESTPSPPSPE